MVLRNLVYALTIGLLVLTGIGCASNAGPGPYVQETLAKLRQAEANKTTMPDKDIEYEHIRHEPTWLERILDPFASGDSGFSNFKLGHPSFKQHSPLHTPSR